MHRRQKKTEPPPHITCTEHLMKFRHAVSKIRQRSDKQTYMPIATTAILRTPLPRNKVIIGTIT